MSTSHIPSLAIATIALLATGCASVIHVDAPPNGVSVEPVQEIQVSFTSNFKPTEAWGVYLDGVRLSAFTPTPAPGSTSKVAVSFDGPSYQHVNSHQITTNATCGTFCVYPNDPPVNFVPPQLLYNGTNTGVDLDLKQFSTAAASVDVQFSRSVPINVTVSEITAGFPKVQLGATAGGLRPPGTPITIVIPAGTTKADFAVQGVSPGQYLLQFSASGVGTGKGAGNIKP